MAPMPTKSDFFLKHELRDSRFVHRLSVAIHQQHFMPGRRERLEQKHPEMRHEIAGYTVVGVVEQNSHDSSLLESSRIHRTGPSRAMPIC
jgi:hypothetical protein